ncbi:MAG: hypothetical protein AAF806_33195 [Bacteroidota bacterium]
MVNLEIKSSVNVRMEEVLEAVRNLDTPELEDFFQQIAEIVVRRKNVLFSNKEEELLTRIKAPALPEKAQAEYEFLYGKLQSETINEEEYQRLSGLMKSIEEKGVERLKYLVELSKLKDKSLSELMIELKIENVTAPIYV